MKDLKVHATTKYEQFRLAPFNRDINSTHLKKLIESMKRKYVPSIAKVDQDNNIIDGQHRFMACKELGLPFYYIKDEMVKHDIITLNTLQRNWTPIDYANYYAEAGVQSYVLVKEFMEYGKMTLSQVLTLAGHLHLKDVNSLFKSGEYKLDEFTYYENFQKYEDITKSLKLQRLSAKCEILALVKGFFPHPDYSHETMVMKCRNYGKGMYYKTAKVVQSLEVFENIYNYQNRNKLNFVAFFNNPLQDNEEK
jgi:hypothetical protein